MSTNVRRSFFGRLLAKGTVATLGVLTATASFAAIELPADKAALIALGEQHRTSWDLYKAFEAQANGGSDSTGRLPD
jgi:hypothetical protein